MRNPKRIKSICKRLEKAWSRNPDLRLGQMVVNAANTKDPYYVEDEQLISMLEGQLNTSFSAEEQV